MEVSHDPMLESCDQDHTPWAYEAKAHLLCRCTISAGEGLVRAVSLVLSRLNRIAQGPSGGRREGEGGRGERRGGREEGGGKERGGREGGREERWRGGRG